MQRGSSACSLSLNTKNPWAETAGELLLVDINGQAPAPFTTAIGEHFLATARGHAGKKAVLADAADVVGLIRALHDAV